MARPIQELTGNTSPIQTPQLSQVAGSNYANVIQKTLDNYRLAMSAVISKQEVETAQWKRISKLAKQYEEERLAHLRAKQQNKKSSNIGAALADLGSSLVSGYMAKQELDYKKSVTERELSLKERAFEQNEQAAQREAEIAQLDGLIDYNLNMLDEEIARTAIDFGREEGYAQLNNLIDSQFNELLPNLSETNRFRVLSRIQAWKAKYLQSQQDSLIGEREAMTNESIGQAAEMFNTRTMDIYAEIRNGASVLSPEDVYSMTQEMVTIANDIVASDDAFRNMLRNPRHAARYYSTISKRINTALEEYYNTTGKSNADTVRWLEATQRVNALEQLRDAKEIDEGKFAQLAGAELSKLGMNPDVSSLPTERTRTIQRENQRRAETTAYNEAVSRDARLAELAENNPQINARRGYHTSLTVFNAINNTNSRGVEGTIAYYNELKKLDESRYNAENGDAVLQILGSWDTDRQQYQNLKDRVLQREQELAKLSRPDDERVVIQKPDGINDLEAPTAETIPVPQPIPRASAEELEALRKQIDNDNQSIRILEQKWARNGINIGNPSDSKLLDELNQRTQAAEDLVRQSPEYRRQEPSEVPSVDETMQQSGASSTQRKGGAERLNGALEFEVGRAFGDNPVAKLTTEFTKDQLDASKESLSTVKSTYDSVIKKMISDVAAGRTYDVDGLVSTLETLPGDDEVTNKVKEGLISNIREADKLLKGKAKWYRQKWGERQSSSQPTNFSQGSTPQRAEQVELPKPSAPSTSTVPLKGNLIVSPISGGYAPFKGGDIWYTSDFQGKDRTNWGRPRPDHNGLDLGSSDPRVATIQGGTVVAAGNLDPDGYGNLVVVKTPDGRYEWFAHLSKISVKKGDVIDPATQIGIMGGAKGQPGAGLSSGTHLHFAVSRDYKGNAHATQWEDPMAYMGQFTGAIELPRGRGATPSGEPDNAVGSTVRNTGVYRMNDHLRYVGGYVYDRRTGQLRRATSSERNNTSSYVPVTTTVHRGVNNSGQTTTPQPQNSGSRTVTRYKLPPQASGEKTYLFVYPTGRKSTRSGQPVLAVEGWANGRKLFSVEAVSGETGIDGNRTVAGRAGMMPDGQWRVAASPRGSSHPGVGDKFLDLTPTFGGHNRSAIGIHWDADLDGDSAGCLATLTKADRDKIYNFIRQHKPRHLYINTRDKETVTVRDTSQNQAPPQQASAVASAYTSNGSINNKPNANYGYKELERDPKLALAFKQAADALGIPAQWLVDVLDTETSGFGNPKNSFDGLSSGIFQLTDASRRWLHPGMTRAQYVAKGRYWQLTVSFVKYIKTLEKEAGKKVNSPHDLMAAIWGGGGGLKMSNAQRMTRLRTRWETWSQKMGKVGRRAGRSYNPRGSGGGSGGASIRHTNPRDNCQTCRMMQLNGDFTQHVVRGQ